MNNNKRCGLANLGNTCYLNSLIQTFSNIPIFRDYIINEHELIKQFNFTDNFNENIKLINQSVIFQLYKIIYIQWNTDTKNIIPLKFKKCLQIKNDIFSSNLEQDVEEVFCFLIEAMHTETCYKIENFNKFNNIEINESIKKNWNTHSMIYNMFYGIHSETHFCKSCNYKNIHYIPSLSLILQIPTLNYSNINLLDCISIKSNIEPVTISLNQKQLMCNIIETNLLDEFIKYQKNPSFTLNDCFNEYNNDINLDFTCPSCNEKNMFSNSKIVIPPKILVIFIKRFVNINDDLIKKKNLIFFPFDLDINSIYNPGLDITDTNYKLVSVINHIGSNIETGHYTTYSLCDTDNNWYSYDDSCVRQISIDNIVTNNAYLLFYSKV
jgi:ubiquitin C-terminal hydrolase